MTRLVTSAFDGAERPDDMRRCQRLRYEVYFEELGLEPPALDHSARLDAEPNDPLCRFFTVSDADADADELIGCIRLQPPGAGPLYSAEEFVLSDPWWRETKLVEGARYAVRREHRGGVAPLMLFHEFRRHCHRHGADQLVSTALLPDPARDPAWAIGALRWMGPRVRLDLARAHPRPGYVVDAIADLVDRGLEATPALERDDIPSMLRMLTTPRTTVCALPAYCDSFRAWVFLLVTNLAPPGRPAQPDEGSSG